VQEQLDSLKGQVRKLFATVGGHEKSLDAMTATVQEVSDSISRAYTIMGRDRGYIDKAFTRLSQHADDLEIAHSRLRELEKSPRTTPLQWLVKKVFGEWPDMV
jgi:hypothetical protein